MRNSHAPRRADSVPSGIPDRGCGQVLVASPASDDSYTGRAGERLSGRTASSRPRITVFTRGYSPAHLVSGPTRSRFALVEALTADFRFSFITSAFEDPAAGPMPLVKTDRWSTRGDPPGVGANRAMFHALTSGGPL